MSKETFSISFNRNEYKTEENFKILESIKGVTKSSLEHCFGFHEITFENFKDMEMFCNELEKKTNYNAYVIISFNPNELFIELDSDL